jgi:DNA-binding NtrC family response regulator
MTEAEQTPRTILFVDDDEDIRYLMTMVATRLGIENFEVFESADTVVERIGDLDRLAAGIISDGLNGGWQDVVAAAREAQIPVVVLTGERIQEEVEAEGAMFLAKPIGIDVLRTVIEGFQTAVDRQD